METRRTKLLTSQEVMEDLGISKSHLLNLRKLGILNPLFLGNGWKFSQDEICDFIANYKGLDVSNYEKAKKAKEFVGEVRSHEN